MKHLSRKIKIALCSLVICLAIFIGLSKSGIIFSENGGDVITVSTTKKTFDPNNFVASMASVSNKVQETTTETTTTAMSTTTTTTTTVQTTVETTTSYVWNGKVLSKASGSVMGPSGKETYYNLDLSSIIRSMRNAGYSESEYPYWVREDGVKMLGQYVIVAANYKIRPKGSIIESSLGAAIVCDTGSFVNSNPTQIDVAVNWR